MLANANGDAISFATLLNCTKRLRAVQIAVVLLLLIVIFSVVKRFVIDMPNLAAGTLPEDRV